MKGLSGEKFCELVEQGVLTNEGELSPVAIDAAKEAARLLLLDLTKALSPPSAVERRRKD